MNKILTIFTIVGGHFSLGKRLHGVGFLLLLIVAPILAAILATASLPFLKLPPSVAEILVSTIYFISVGLVWACSVRVVIRYSERADFTGKQLGGLALLEATGAGILAWLTIGIGLIVFVVGVSPFLDQERNPPLVPSDRAAWQKKSEVVQYRKLPATDGTIVLLCNVELQGRPLKKEKIRLTFAGGYASEFASTNNEGQFSVQLPPGEWRLIGPDLPTFKSREVRYEILDPSASRNRTFVSAEGPPTTRVRIIFWIDGEKSL